MTLHTARKYAIAAVSSALTVIALFATAQAYQIPPGRIPAEVNPPAPRPRVQPATGTPRYVPNTPQPQLPQSRPIEFTIHFHSLDKPMTPGNPDYGWHIEAHFDTNAVVDDPAKWIKILEENMRKQFGANYGIHNATERPE